MALTHHEPRRLAEIDALRGIAACMVVLFHYTTRYDQLIGHSHPLMFGLPWGHVGVNLFFIISGFVIFMTLDRTRHAGDFIVSRFSRLYPSYWASVALTFLVVSLSGLPGKQVTGMDAVYNLSMLHGSFGIPHVDSVYWTLEVELLFYLLVFALFQLRVQAQTHWALYLLMALSSLNHLAQQYLGIRLPWRVEWLLILPFIPWFACGIAIFRTLRDRSTLGHDVAILMLAPLVLTLTQNWKSGLLCVLFSGLVWAAAKQRLPMLRNSVLLWLGFISYPLYLLHENIGWSVIHALESRDIHSGWAVVLSLALALGLSTLMSVWVERPAMKWIRSRFATAPSHQGAWRQVIQIVMAILLAMGAGFYTMGARAGLTRSPHTAEVQVDNEQGCADLLKKSPLVVLILGQSNAGNHGGDAPDARTAPIVHHGRCYLSHDPLPGATGDKQSIWTRLPEHLKQAGIDRPILLSVVSIESTRIDAWITRGEIQTRLRDQIAGLRRIGAYPHFILWQQGEADARDKTTSRAYAERLVSLRGMLDQLNIPAPILIAQASLCRSAPDPAIRAAQANSPTTSDRLLKGPDLDQLGSDLRRDGCHFSRDGLDRAAALWAGSLAQHLRQPAAQPPKETTKP